MCDREYVEINNIRVPIEEFSKRRLGKLPNEGKCSEDPTLSLYAEVLWGMRDNIYI